MEKTYISNILSEREYGRWLSGEKVIINAPTGSGKTFFILKQFLPYCKQKKKRMLILCNRRLLADQYKFDLSDQYFRFSEMEEDLTVCTYQEIAEHVKNCYNIRTLFEGYDVIICDEVHYFYSDADFNAFGTYVLLQAIVLAGFYKTLVMITATLEEVLPLIQETFCQCKRKLEEHEGCLQTFDRCSFHNQIFDFQYFADFSRFQCYYTPDVESLVNIIASSEKKTLIFIDDKAKAEKFKAALINQGMSSGNVYLLNAQTLDERADDEVILTLCSANRLLPKVLITTSVLDNGVSIHDAEVGNLVIATDSRVSFLQMIGRIRSEDCEACRLFIFPQDTKYYKRRLEQCKKKMQFFQELSAVPLETREFLLLANGWYGNDEDAEFLRNAIVITKDDCEYYADQSALISLKRGEITLAMNAFAKEKCGNELNTIKNFFRLALDSPQKVAEKKIAWLSKSPDELFVMDSSYLEQKKNAMIKELLTVREFTNEEMQQFKKDFSKKYRKDFFPDLVVKNGSFALEKLKEICGRYGLLIKETVEAGRKSYSIMEAESFNKDE